MAGHRSVLALVASCILALGLAAQGLKPAEIIDLVRLGYGDAEIRAELEKAKDFPRFSAAELAELAAAGASRALVDFVRAKSAPPPVDLERLRAWLREKRPAPWILQQVLGAQALPAISDVDAEQLAALGAPRVLLLTLRGRALGLEELRELAGARLAEETQLAIYRRLGHTASDLSPTESVELLREGLAKSVLEAIRAEIRMRAERRAKELPCVRARLEDGRFEHRGRRFEIRTPKDWWHYRDLREGQVRYAFSPLPEAERIDALDVALTFTLTSLDPRSVFGGQDAKSVLERLVPVMRLMEPGLSPAGEITSARMGAHEAASLRLRGRPSIRDTEVELELRLAVEPPLVFVATAVTPLGRYEEHAQVFEQILRESRFGSPHGERRSDALAAHAISERYRASVVYVEGKTGFRRGQGTGFLIREDGYLLTNWHVIWNSEADAPHDSLLVRWDEQLRRPTVPARLVGFARRQTAEYRLGGALGGDDVALLKIDGADHVPLPLSASSVVRLGDPIVTLGFPKSFSLATLSTFLTQGVVTRFNRNITGHVESYATDAKTTHGSSGGPCIDLVTGGVIGLNTWGYDIGMRTKEGESLDDFVGYSFVCPIDAALRHFPLVVDFGLGEKPDLGFFETFDLCQLCLGTRAYEAAAQLADTCVQLQGRSADALWLRAVAHEAHGWSLLEQGREEEALRQLGRARSSYEQALHHDAGHAASLIASTRLLTTMGELPAAGERAAEAIARCADDWSAFAAAAEVAIAQKKLTEASQHAARAVTLARDIVPDGHVLAGRIAYLRGWHEEGQREFAEAVRIHPRSFEARAGAAEYFEHAERWDEAIAAWQRFTDDFAGHPLGLYRLGFAHAKAERLDDALSAFDQAASSYEKHGLVPPHSFFLEFAELQEAKGSVAGAIYCLGRHLGQHGAAADAWQVHMKVAELFRGEKIRSLASLHARAAERLRKAAGQEFEAKDDPLTPPNLEGIKWIVTSGRYPDSVSCDLIANHPLAYAIPLEPEQARDEEIQKLLGAKIPGAVILAIIQSNKRFPAAPQQPPRTGPADPNQPVGPAQPRDDVTKPDSNDQLAQQNRQLIVGVWVFKHMDPLVGQIDIRMSFDAAGKWRIQGIMGGFPVDDSGDYEVDGKTLTAHVRQSTNPIGQGQVNTWPMKVSQQSLQLYYASLRKWIEFRRAQ